MKKKKAKLIQSLFYEKNDYNDLEKNILFHMITSEEAVSYREIKNYFGFPHIDLDRILYRLMKEKWLIEYLASRERYYIFNHRRKVKNIFNKTG